MASACSNKEAASNDKKEQTEQTDQVKNPKTEEQEVHDFVLENTKIVKIFNMSKRVDEKRPDLGPFFVVRGIDERGQKSEAWIKDLKVYEIVKSN